MQKITALGEISLAPQNVNKPTVFLLPRQSPLVDHAPPLRSAKHYFIYQLRRRACTKDIRCPAVQTSIDSEQI
jgi:hypothetical protein